MEPKKYFPLPVISIDGKTNKLNRAACSAHLPVYYEEMHADGTFKWGFYDGGADNLRTFLRLALDPNVIFMLCYSRENYKSPVGHIMLTRFNGYCSMVHFNVLRKYHPEAKEICSTILDTIFALKRPDGTPLVSTLIGLTPRKNHAARKLNKALGFEEFYRLEKACHLIYWNRFDTGILTERVEEWETKKLDQQPTQILGLNKNASLS